MRTSMAFLPSPTQMRNPRVVRWVLQRLEQAQEADDEVRAREFAALLDAPALQWLLGSEHEMLATDALRLLDTGHLARIEDWLFEHWNTLTGTRARWASVRIAELAPEEFREVVGRALDTGTTAEQVCKSPGLLEGLAGMGPAARPIATRLLDGIKAASLSPWRLEAAVALSTRAGTPHAASMIAAVLRARSSDETVVSTVLGTAYRAVTGGLPYFAHFEDVADGASRQRLADVPEYFDEGAPLTDLDRVAHGSQSKRLKAAQRLLRQSGEEGAASNLTLAILDDVGRKKASRDAKNALASLCLAAVAASYAREEFDPKAMETPDLLRLLAADLYSLPLRVPIVEELVRRDDDQTTTAILDLLESGDNGSGASNLVDLMGARRSGRFIEPLIRTLGGGWADQLSDEAVLALGRYGLQAEAAIIDRWDQLDGTQRIYAFDVLERVGGERTVDHLLDILPEYRAASDRLEQWCALAEAVPDPRTVEALLPELHRAHPVIDGGVVTLCELLDQHPDGLDEARERTAKHDERIFRGVEGMQTQSAAAAPSETIQMDLACPECDDENSFEVRRVYLAAEDPKQEPYIGDDLTCPSCGFRGTFRSSRAARLPLMGLLLRNLVPGLRGDDGSIGPLQIVRRFVVGGKEMSPAEIIGYYKQRLTTDPDDVVSLLALGNTYSTLGPERLAADCYRRCLDLDPTCVEAPYALSDIECGAGNHERAWALLNQAWSVRSDWHFHRLQDASPQEFEAAFVEAHDSLARRLGRPVIGGEPRRIPVHDLPSGPSPVRPKKKKRKIGRNEPCPCGSGKKYKRCCL